MASIVAVAPAPARGSSWHAAYGVGIRVFNDRRLLRQIRTEIARNAMQAEEIAALENVTPEVLIALLEERLASEADSGTRLREYATAHDGFRVAAWRTTRKHSSKLHILDRSGTALCGTPAGAEQAAVDSGPCMTCAAHAGIAPSPPAVQVV
jgi:hypothetical protein